MIVQRRCEDHDVAAARRDLGDPSARTPRYSRLGRELQLHLSRRAFTSKPRSSGRLRRRCRSADARSLRPCRAPSVNRTDVLSAAALCELGERSEAAADDRARESERPQLTTSRRVCMGLLCFGSLPASRGFLAARAAIHHQSYAFSISPARKFRHECVDELRQFLRCPTFGDGGDVVGIAAGSHC